jgi:hemerythrin-like domain-containing protein
MMNPVETTLENDHHSLAKLLGELEAGLVQGNISHSFDLLDSFWARLAVHIRAENLALFPTLSEVPSNQFNAANDLLSFAKAEELLSRLRADHDFFMKELASMVKVMRRMKETDSASSDQLEDLRKRLTVIDERLREHNRLEEEQVYKWPTVLLDAQTLSELHNRIRREIGNVPSRFKCLIV